LVEVCPQSLARIKVDGDVLESQEAVVGPKAVVDDALIGLVDDVVGPAISDVGAAPPEEEGGDSEEEEEEGEVVVEKAENALHGAVGIVWGRRVEGWRVGKA